VLDIQFPKVLFAKPHFSQILITLVILVNISANYCFSSDDGLVFLKLKYNAIS
jgi:hypothetical protein